MAMTPLPDAPSRTQSGDDFSDTADAFVAALPTFVTEANTLQTDVTTKQATASAAAVAAATSETNAATSAAGAVTAANVTKWITGTNYSQGACVWSPTDYKTYRCRVAGVSSTDPNADPTNWEILTYTQGAGGSSASGATTFSASTGVLSVTPTAPGQYVTLAAATTFQKGVAGIIENLGNYDLGIKDNSGTKLGWIRSRSASTIGCRSNTTTAGSWAIPNLQKTGVTARFLNTSATNTDNGNIQRVAIDSNRTCFIVGGTSIYGVVYDSSTQTWGSATLIRSSISSGKYLSILSAASQVLVVSCNSTTAVEAVTLTIDSTTGITVNSGTKGTATLAGNIASVGQLIAVGSTWCWSYGRATTVSGIREITISGTTPTISSEAALPPSVTTSGSLYAVTSTVVLTLSVGSGTFYAKPFTLNGNGTAPTAGTAATQATTSNEYRSLALGSGRWAAATINTTTFAMIISVSGTVATISATSLGTAASTSAGTLDMIAVSSTKVCVGYHAGSTTFYVNNIVDNSGTVNVGTEFSQTVTGNATSASFVPFYVTGNTVTFALKTASTQYSIVVDASANTPTLTSIVPLLGVAGRGLIVSDIYGVRSARTLVGGSVGYSPIANVADGYAVSFSSTGPEIYNPPNIPAQATNSGGAAGSTNASSWLIDSLGSTTAGISIVHVEAAA
jgi:hypothetical protein